MNIYLKYKAICPKQQITMVVWLEMATALRVVPGINRDKVSDKAGNVTLEQGIIAENDISLLVNMSLEVLSNDWSKKTGKQSPTNLL